MSDHDDWRPGGKPATALLDRCRVTSARGFALQHHGTGTVAAGLDKPRAAALLKQGIEHLAAQQALLYAERRRALLLVFQGMDASGKDSAIRHVLSGLDPRGVAVTSFGPPGPDDLAHTFLWRVSRSLPARGTIGAFNRSHYEDVLVSRVHPATLDAQPLPPDRAAGPSFWEGRLDDIAGFERHLGREGTRVVKFFLNVSPHEQRKRLLARLDEPGKAWKFDPDDVTERRAWDRYMAAYEAAIAATATEAAPWFVVPADHKWFARLIVASAVNEALASLGLKPAVPDPARAARFADARRALDAEGGRG